MDTIRLTAGAHLGFKQVVKQLGSKADGVSPIDRIGRMDGQLRIGEALIFR